MPPRGVNRKIVEKYFDFCGEVAKCKICSHELKSDRVYNLKIHISRVHKISDDVLNSETGKLKNVKKEERKQCIKIEISKKQLFRSYIGLVTEDSLPFNILNSENFKNIIDPIC